MESKLTPYDNLKDYLNRVRELIRKYLRFLKKGKHSLSILEEIIFEKKIDTSSFMDLKDIRDFESAIIALFSGKDDLINVACNIIQKYDMEKLVLHYGNIELFITALYQIILKRFELKVYLSCIKSALSVLERTLSMRSDIDPLNEGLIRLALYAVKFYLSDSNSRKKLKKEIIEMSLITAKEKEKLIFDLAKVVVLYDLGISESFAKLIPLLMINKLDILLEKAQESYIISSEEPLILLSPLTIFFVYRGLNLMEKVYNEFEKLRYQIMGGIKCLLIMLLPFPILILFSVVVYYLPVIVVKIISSTIGLLFITSLLMFSIVEAILRGSESYVRRYLVGLLEKLILWTYRYISENLSTKIAWWYIRHKYKPSII